jgi:hypothetical protein
MFTFGTTLPETKGWKWICDLIFSAFISYCFWPIVVGYYFKTKIL